MDFANMTFIGLMTVGAVNVVTFFVKDLKSEYKFALSVAVAFGLTFVPEAIGGVILEKAKLALEIGLASSGGYKLATRAGGIK